MGRSPPLGMDGNDGVNDNNNNNNNAKPNGKPNGNNSDNDVGLYAIRDRFPFKRTSSHSRDRLKSGSDRPSLRNRPQHAGRGLKSKGFLSLFKFRGAYLFYAVILFAVCAFVMSVMMQSSITSVFRQGSEQGRSVRDGLKIGSTLKFVPGRLARALMEGEGLDRLRSVIRIGIRSPRLALILGNMKRDPQSLMLISVMKNLQRLGYVLKVYAIDNGEAHSMLDELGGHTTVLPVHEDPNIDWTMFEGIIADSLEAKDVISSLMQEPFRAVPLIWIIQEDVLANRLPVYKEMGQSHLVSHWRRAFSRADVMVFPDFTLPMLYSVLDTGNFFVIPGSPVDVWAAESYSKTHTKLSLRNANGFSEEDLVILVIGSSFFYNELSWDYAVAMHALGPLLVKYGRRKDVGGPFKFVFLFGNSTDGYSDALQEATSRLGLAEDAVRRYGMNDDVNSFLLMADIILYASSQEEQGFPPLITRAMTFGIPVLTPDFPIMKKYISDEAHAIFYPRHDPDSLLRTFSLLVSNGRLTKFAQTVASSGRLLAKNMLASECISGYARLLENILDFPSDAVLPGSISQLQQSVWEWNSLKKNVGHRASDVRTMNVTDAYSRSSAITYELEERFRSTEDFIKSNGNNTGLYPEDVISKVDWDVLEAIEELEEFERVETEELEERMETKVGDWDEIYRNARKSEKLRFESNERDEGELERTGQPVCIYEIYSAAGAWPFLHHGSLYRGLSLSTKARRLSSDDVNGVDRLILLNDTHYRDLLCDIGGMFAIANKVDSIHLRPWIGFQSWRAAGRKLSLSAEAEKVVEEVTQQGRRGDVIYFWARLDMDMDDEGTENKHALTFWSMCDILNGGNCRTVFENAFRRMYKLPSNVEALPPMPEDGDHWSALHSWVMPTPSFLEFVMFSRMFADSLDALHSNSTKPKTCMLGSSRLETRHCYCRVLEVLVNVWAYHSGRKIVYIDPRSGALEEQHPYEQRKGHMWVKYFDLKLLKIMDEDLAEAAQDDDYPQKMWLWPLTGELHWPGVYEREREARYRQKMDKKRKIKDKHIERGQKGYKQKPLGR